MQTLRDRSKSSGRVYDDLFAYIEGQEALAGIKSYKSAQRDLEDECWYQDDDSASAIAEETIMELWPTLEEIILDVVYDCSEYGVAPPKYKDTSSLHKDFMMGFKLYDLLQGVVFDWEFEHHVYSD